MTEKPDYDEIPVWPDEEEEEAGGTSTKLFTVSENTNKFF